jgi:DNA invertase Pin-like site-specific DNA recombinase
VIVRPALQALLAEVRARRIDVVAVYKVGRLTRSLCMGQNRPKHKVRLPIRFRSSS